MPSGRCPRISPRMRRSNGGSGASRRLRPGSTTACGVDPRLRLYVDMRRNGGPNPTRGHAGAQPAPLGVEVQGRQSLSRRARAGGGAAGRVLVGRAAAGQSVCRCAARDNSVERCWARVARVRARSLSGPPSSANWACSSARAANHAAASAVLVLGPGRFIQSLVIAVNTFIAAGLRCSRLASVVAGRGGR